MKPLPLPARRSVQADMFTTANYTTAMRQPDREYLKECIPEFFAPHGETLPEPLAGCSRRPGRIDFIHSPLFQSQSKVWSRGSGAANPDGVKGRVPYNGSGTWNVFY